MEFAPDGEFSCKVESLCSSASLGIPFHWDRLFGRVIAAVDSEQEIAGTCFSGAVADPDFDGGFGGIRIQMNLVDPNEGSGTQLDFSDDTVPDRLSVFDVGMGPSDIKLLSIIDTNEKIVFSWSRGGEIELVGCAEGVLFSDLFSIQPDTTFPDNPLQKEGDTFPIPLFWDFDGASVPSGPDVGEVSDKTCQTCLTDFGCCKTWGTESGLVGCARQVDEVIEGSLRIQPILAKAEVFGVESDLPLSCKGLRCAVTPASGKKRKKGEKATQS